MLMGPRVAEDVILTNVIGFDVKVWDPMRRCCNSQVRRSSWHRAIRAIPGCLPPRRHKTCKTW